MKMKTEVRNTNSLPLVVAGVILTLAMPLQARAEAPMNTDDAGTMAKGGMKIEATWGRDDHEHAGEIAFGYSPVDDLELAVSLGHASDDGAHPDTRTDGYGFSAKWVPYQNDTGWSAGIGLAYGHDAIDDREADEEYTGHEYSLTGLASYRRENGQVLHLNLGTVCSRSDGEHETVGTWGVGYEIPLAERLQLTLEAFGEQHAEADKAIGLRYEIFDGIKVSAGYGQGNDRSFGQVGMAWEF